VTAAPSFDAIVQELGPALWRLTSAYARSHADREDLYQEVLTAVWRALPHFRGGASLRTYVLRIGHNRGLTHRARNARQGEVDDGAIEDLPDQTPHPDERLDRDLLRARLANAVRRLPATLAQPVMLNLEGLSHAEIAEVLGITENNVGVRMNRARAALARELGARDL